MCACTVCDQLRDVETSFYKYAAPDYDRPLPPAAAQLAIVMTPDTTAPETAHVRCCPVCGTLYRYAFSYEYFVNGSEDEEELTRMTPAQADDYLRHQARSLEALRREIEDLENSAGSLGDFIDHGNLSSAETEAAITDMQEALRGARQLREKLRAQVASLRRSCVGILTTWAAAHVYTCQHYLAFPSGPAADADDARYVAQSTLAAWEQLPHRGETFITTATAWMDGYQARVDRELSA